MLIDIKKNRIKKIEILLIKLDNFSKTYLQSGKYVKFDNDVSLQKEYLENKKVTILSETPTYTEIEQELKKLIKEIEQKIQF